MELHLCHAVSQKHAKEKRKLTRATNRNTYKCKQYHESGDVTNHSPKRYLEWAQDFEGWHQLCSPGEADDIGNGKQNV